MNLAKLRSIRNNKIHSKTTRMLETMDLLIDNSDKTQKKIFLSKQLKETNAKMNEATKAPGIKEI